ncbi:hypothetical protein RCO48_04980 [Peribacillus frigoritolerans]|nr:hypothetical protein [Peribacillus frigoritolerans]
MDILGKYEGDTVIGKGENLVKLETNNGKNRDNEIVVKHEKPIQLGLASVCRQKGSELKKIRSPFEIPIEFRLKLTDGGSTSPLC